MPLLFDMPLEECKKYMGTNPKPADFDEYWDASLEEMKNTEANFEMIPCKYNFGSVEAYDIFWTGVNGARIHGKLVKPKDVANPMTCVIEPHGYSGCSRDFFWLMQYAAMGWVGVSLDCRGQSGLSEDVGGVKGTTFHGTMVRGLMDEDPKKMMMRDVYLDHAQLAGILMEQSFVDETKVYVCGGSQGGGLSAAMAALEPRIAKAAIQMPFLTDYKRVWDIDLAKDAYQEIKDFFRNYDPLHEKEDYVWTRLGYIDVHFLAPRIKAKVIMCTGLLDTVCPPSTQFAIYNNIKSEKKVLFWPDYGHEFYPEFDNIKLEFFAEN